ncbi:hypothetical protein [Lacticaseibacillus sp. 53-4]|uniref:hypothetical protein n=1 Tax=Lacticaseibacillus sp. 53-4 TaxID=2799575 RepID=UPI001945714D|nr:hypothetical protein [Lacticaseibacillus sp. 53-4]
MPDTKPNILKRRVNGAVKPLEGFTDKPEPVETVKSKTAEGKRNQQKSIKISAETYKDLSVLKSMEGIKFDYEAVQMLIDQYVSRLSDSDQRRFTVLRENS